MPYELVKIKITVYPKLILSFYVLEKMSAAFIGAYNFDARDISHKFMIAFVMDKRSSSNVEANKMRDICKSLGTIQSSFDSVVNAFTVLEGSVMKLWHN